MLFLVAALTAGSVASAPLPSYAQDPLEDRVFEEIGRLERAPEDARRIFGDRIVFEGYYDPPGSRERAHSGRYPGSGTLVAVPEAGQLWQIFETGTGSGTAIAVRDMDTLRIVKALDLGDLGLRRQGAGNGQGGWLMARDGDRRLFLGVDYPYRGFISIDLRTFAITTYNRSAETLNRLALGGMEYDPFGDRMLVLVGGPVQSTSVVNSVTSVVAVDLKTREESVRPIRACNAPIPSTETNTTTQFAPYVANERFVYIPCHKAGYSGAVVRIDRPDLMDPAGAEQVVVGPTGLEGAYVDRKAGKIVMTTTRGVIWMFDTAAMAFVGVVGAYAGQGSPKMGAGVDSETGRVFFLSSTEGLGVFEGRMFPVPQARTRRDVASSGQEEIVSHASSGRVFVLHGDNKSKDPFYRIYRTNPAPTPPPLPDPDANTVDQPEQSGVNESRYNAGASAYGARVLLANGLTPVAPAVGIGALFPTADFFRHTFNAKCGFTDRELVAARVARTEADTGSTAAEAAAVVIDDRTRLDIDRPSRCEPYGKDGSTDRLEVIFSTAPEPYDNTDERNPRWNRDPAVCSTSSGDEPVEANGDDHGAPPLGTARAECPSPDKGEVRASARTALAGVITVGRAQAETTITRVAGRVRSRAESLASDVSIGEGIRIGEIRSVAVSESDGRPAKKAMSTHVVTIRDLSIGGTDVCGVCDPTEALETLNRAVSGRAEFRFGVGAADPRLVKGSPKGALTAVQKSVERQVSDRSLVGDFAIDIPALELVVYNDNGTWGRGRQLYQFAGVATSATYNIVPLPRFGGDDAGDGGDDNSGAASTVATGDDPMAGADGGSAFAVERTAAESDDDGGFAAGLVRRIGRALAAVGRGLRLFVSDPRHGLAILTGWALLGLPAALVRRRLALVAD